MIHHVMARIDEEDYFVLSPFYIPMPGGEMEELELPGAMIEEHLSKRLRLNRPFYRIPPPSTTEVWKKPAGAKEGYRILVHRCFLSLQHSVIIHDYIHVKCVNAIGGWIQKYVAYYDTEKELYPYDEYACESIEINKGSVLPFVASSTAFNILRSCSSSVSLPPPPPQPIQPRTIKRIKPVPALIHPLT